MADQRWFDIHTLYNVCAVPWGVLSTVGGVQYRGGISWVPWGVFSTVGDIMINVGDILSTVEGVQYRGGYHEYRGGLSWVPWGMFSTVGGYRDACGGYHEYRGGCSVPWGDTILWNLSTVGGYHDICGGISWVPWGVFSTVGYSNNKRFFPPRYWTPSTVLMISPTCIMISPHGTEHPPQYSR